ncbi:hypothetical protein [Tsukamurella hominis]|uniref:hypothetical protein n=1 Tax=Tsukamurella hominis TaxID=1970232 RepID=UPI0039E7A857
MSGNIGPLPETLAMRGLVLDLVRSARGPLSTKEIVETVMAFHGTPDDLNGYSEYQYWYNRAYPQLRKLMKLGEVTSCWSARERNTSWTAAGRPHVRITIRPRDRAPQPAPATSEDDVPDALGDNARRHRACRACEKVPEQKTPMRRGLCNLCFRANKIAGTLSNWPPLPKGANSGFEIDWAREARARRAARAARRLQAG